MGVTAAVGLTLISINEQKKREKRVSQAQARAREVETATRANEARRARREQVREARIRQAEIENQAAVGGQTGSSAAIAAGSSLQGRLGTNIGSIQEALAFGSAQSNAEQDIFEAGRKSNIELFTEAGFQIASFAK